MKTSNIILLIACLLIISGYILSIYHSNNISIIHSTTPAIANQKNTHPEIISKSQQHINPKLKSNYESHLLITNPIVIADKLKELSEEERALIWEKLSNKIDTTLSANSLSAISNQDALNLKLKILNHSYSNDSSFEKLVKSEIYATTNNIKKNINSIITENNLKAQIDNSSLTHSPEDACEAMEEITNSSNISNSNKSMLAKHNCYKQQERYFINNNPNISDQELAKQLKLIRERTYTSIH